MADKAKDSVRTQFGRQASWYSVSPVHRHSNGLTELLRLASPDAGDRALDVATGTGFTALALARACRRVVGLDLTGGMVREAEALRAARGAHNLAFCLGDAEAIPFATGSFDIVTCRHAAHHFLHFAQALGDMARVARSGGRVVLDDTCAPEDPALAALMNEWELRRDPSHLANHPPSRIEALFEECGLHVEEAVMTRVDLEFDDWVRRAGVPERQAAALRADFLGAQSGARSAFQIRTEGGTLRFAWDEVVILGVKR